ncbi:MAG TPA: PQQ-binding-like beta-propeller repeat protein [Ktedonobacterales bacterium]|nr:PQQ-binding-like beta-propeller repeat protein [Ktedonobacterales bacterium]
MAVPWSMLSLFALITIGVIGLATVIVGALATLRARRMPGRVVAGGALVLSTALVLSGLLWYHVRTTPPANQPAPVSASAGLYTVVLDARGAVQLVALRARDATVAWQRSEPSYPLRLAVANGVVYTARAASGVLLVEALRADDGRTLWSTPVEEATPIPQPELHLLADPVITDGRVVVDVTYAVGSTASTQVDALDAASGTVIWRRTAERAIGSVLAVSGTLQALDVGSGRVFVGSSDGSMVALDERTGAPLWRTAAATPSLAQDDTTLPLFHDGVLYVYRPWRVGPLMVLRPSDGAELWRFPAAGSGITIGGPPAFSPDDATIYLNAGNAGFAQHPAPAHLVAINAADHTMRWQYAFDNGAIGSPAVTADAVYVGTSSALSAFRTGDGHLLWQARNFEQVGYSYPVVADGVIFALASNQLPAFTPCGLHCGVEVLYVLRLNDGSPYWRYPVTYPGPIVIAAS